MLKTVKIPKQFEPIFEKAQEFVSRYFEGKKEDPTKGTIEIFGERYILVRAASLSVDFFETVMKLYEKEGKEEALNITRQLLFDIAHAIGKQDARNFHNKMNLNDPIEKLSAGPIHFSHSGWAFVDIFPESNPSPDENYYLIYDHPYSFESSAWLQAGKKSDFPVCIMNAGYSSGWCDESFGITLVALEIMCKAKGDDACRFIMAPPSRIQGHIANHIKEGSKLAEKITKYEIPGFFKRKELEAELHCSEQRFRAMFENATDGILLIDLESRKFLDGNKMICQMLGYRLEEIRNLGIVDICSGKDMLYITEHLNKLTRGEITPAKDLPVKRKDGTVFYTDVNCSPMKLNGITYLVGVFRDITERRQAKKMIERLNHEKKLVLNAAGEGILGLDIHGNHTFVNPAAAQLLGYAVDELISRHSHTTWHYKKADGSPYPMEECPIYATYKNGEVYRITEEVFWRKDGTSFPVEYNTTPIIEDEKIIGTVVTFNDISGRKQMEEELRALSLIDELTGLYNRRGFLTLVKQQTKIAERMKKEMLLIFADIDKMKLINDTLGHKEGDRALIDAANILRKTLRNSDIIARFGGDEFVALAMEACDEHAEIIYSRLQDNIKLHNEKEVRSYKISLSLGFVCYVPGSSIEELLLQADQLMYEDKQKKRVESDEG